MNDNTEATQATNHEKAFFFMHSQSRPASNLSLRFGHKVGLNFFYSSSMEVTKHVLFSCVTLIWLSLKIYFTHPLNVLKIYLTFFEVCPSYLTVSNHFSTKCK